MWEDLEKLGIVPFYKDESVIIINDDCRNVLSKLPDKYVDLVLTDPPYGLEWHSGHYVGFNPHKEIANDDRYPVEILVDLKRVTTKAILLFCRWDNLRELPPPEIFYCVE